MDNTIVDSRAFRSGPEGSFDGIWVTHGGHRYWVDLSIVPWPSKGARNAALTRSTRADKAAEASAAAEEHVG